ncbi:MAG TPA: gliding motility-associated C-terminal domain-containing protein, partial [Salinivirgaceae bacterium]|nr:gliding motility-associated C-terminal domain-containing protein [Salinivirgaceae bacterium]
TDNTSCSVTEQINLSDNTTLAANTVSITNVTCAGSTTGSATIEVTGGVMPYTIVWNNGQTGNTISNVGAGNYTATITDAQNCTIFYTVTINENPPIVSTFVFTQPIHCAEYPYATFHVDVTGGVQPYSFEWRNQANQVLGTSAELQNMGGGRYYIQITDALGCQKLDSVDVIVPNPIQITFNTTQTDCATPTGTVTAIVEGGATPYAYQWANFENPSMIITGNGTATITNLPAGYYVLTLTDALGCQKTDTAQVESNTNMVLNISNVQSVTCLGRNDGMATLTIENGNEPFTVIWANGDTLYNQTNRIITNTQLYQGTQIVKVIDNSGCVQTRMFTVPTGGALYVVMYSYPDVGGDVADFGIARADALGGVQPYSYQWKNAAGVVVGNTAQINNLNYGWYFVTVTDSNTPSCQWIDSVEVVPSVISYDTLYINHVTCYEYNNGAISVQAKGGEAPYTYRWRHSSWTQDSLGNTITNLIAGIYQLTITDVYGFAPLVTSIEIRQPASMGITLHIVEQTECTIPTGKLQVNFNPIYTPVTPMTYAWAHPGWSSYPAPDSIFVDQNTLNNIGIGWYYVTITDGNGCAETDSVYMTDNSPLALRLSVIHPTCYGLSTGRITAIVTDAIGTVTYSWSHNPTLDSNIAANLAAGHYGLTITDGSSSCQRMADTTLVQPDELIFSILDTIRPTCYNDQNGSIVTQINGGTQPYSLYVINQATGQPTQVPGNTIANISAGTYLIRVVDGNNCVTNYQPVNLRSEAPYMDVSILIDNNPTCNVNSEDGILKATVVAGDHPNLPWVNQPDPSQYTYLWSNGQTLQSATVGMGYYDVTVAYAPYPQCTATNSILVDMAHNNIYPNASLDPLAGITKDSTVCVGDTIAVYSYYNIYGLDGIGRNADSIRWISQNPILVRPITDTIEYYTITSSNTDRNKFYVTVYSNGCSNVDSLTVRTFNLPEVEASAFKIDRTLGSDFEGTEPLRSIFVGNDALIKVTRPVTDSTTYQWSEQYYTTVQGLPTTNSIIAHTNDWTRIVVRPIDSTIYTVRAKTKAYPQRQHYCYSSDTVLVRVLGQFNPPTAFSPNGDGHNDFWKLEGIDQFTSFNVQIFNRWGQQVFESNDINFRWDGTNKKGKELPVGTYYYIIQYTTDSGTKKISGPVTIVR